MLTKTKDISGSVLDWAVAKAIVRNMVSMGDGEYGEWDKNDPICYDPLPKYSSDWAHTGPLIEGYGIKTGPVYWPAKSGGSLWLAVANNDEKCISMGGCTPLTAACRAIVAAEIGEEVDIPDDLCKVK